MLGVLSIFDVKSEKSLQIGVILLIFLYYGCFNCSLGPVVWILGSDILKEEGISLSILVNWTGNICATLLGLNTI